jgi:hypothetical protein
LREGEKLKVKVTGEAEVGTERRRRSDYDAILINEKEGLC